MQARATPKKPERFPFPDCARTAIAQAAHAANLAGYLFSHRELMNERVPRRGVAEFQSGTSAPVCAGAAGPARRRTRLDRCVRAKVLHRFVVRFHGAREQRVILTARTPDTMQQNADLRNQRFQERARVGFD